jgi:hypothetical protein
MTSLTNPSKAFPSQPGSTGRVWKGRKIQTGARGRLEQTRHERAVHERACTGGPSLRDFPRHEHRLRYAGPNPPCWTGSRCPVVSDASRRVSRVLPAHPTLPQSPLPLPLPHALPLLRPPSESPSPLACSRRRPLRRAQPPLPGSRAST